MQRKCFGPKIYPVRMRNNEHSSFTIVQRVWIYCKVLRDDSIFYGADVMQFVCLLFLINEAGRSRMTANLAH
jgi:hypothetical protein